MRGLNAPCLHKGVATAPQHLFRIEEALHLPPDQREELDLYDGRKNATTHTISHCTHMTKSISLQSMFLYHAD